jgi:hypothetical protein
MLSIVRDPDVNLISVLELDYAVRGNNVHKAGTELRQHCTPAQGSIAWWIGDRCRTRK